MIILKLQGGLGNQMFQYAAAKSLSIKLNKHLYVDTSFYRYDPLREYRLGFFPNIQELPLELQEKTLNKLYRIKSYLNKINNKKGKVSVYQYVEDFRAFNTYYDLTRQKQDIIFLQGYFQSEMYFLTIREHISSIFSVKTPFEYNDLIRKIINTESIAIHIRREDYVKNPLNANFYWQCDIAYYQRGIAYITKGKTKQLALFIFSDDIEWVKSNFPKLEYPIIFFENKKKQHPAISLLLMSKCKHIITANSTFSWWAAWLNVNSEKIICTPRKWFKNRSNGDLIPSSWKQL